MKWLIPAILLLSAGCSTLFNPYRSKFQCPETDKGKCVSLQQAYRESLEPQEADQKKAAQEDGHSEEDLFRRELYEKMRKLIREPRAPIVKPPEVMRVLILSYRGRQNELYSWRYVYFFVTEPEWIIRTFEERRCP